MTYFLGVDIGTTATKAVAFSPGGVLLASEAVGYPMAHPRPDWSEQDPERICRAALRAANAVTARLGPESCAFVALSAAMHSLLLLDAESRPLTRLSLWADNRAAGLAAALRALPEGQRLYEETGVPIHAMTPLSRIAWYREQEPALFARTARFAGIKEYFLWRLLGEWVCDHSLAAATGLFDFRARDWSSAALARAGISADRLPRPVSPRTVFPFRPAAGSFAAGLHLPAETPIVIGASDGVLANLAESGDDDTLVATVGTSAAVRINAAEPWTDAAMATFCFPAADRGYVLGASSNNGGVALGWLQQKIFGQEPDVAQLCAQAATVPPGAEGLLFIPYLLGERAPVWDANATASFSGLRIGHGQAHFARAVLEGIALNIARMVAPLLVRRNIRGVAASGGLARSPIWPRLLADALNLPVYLRDTVEASALGAVMTGLLALGLPALPKQPVAERFEPDPANAALYAQLAARQGDLYRSLRAEK